MNTSLDPVGVLHAVEYVVGPSRQVGDLGPLFGETVIKGLLDDGLERYSELRDDPTETGAQALRRTLDVSGVNPADVDMVLFCSISRNSGAFRDHLDGLGLGHAPVLALSMSGCATAASAVPLACAMLARQGWRHIAVVTADRAENPTDRLTQLGAAILSDGAASFLVSREAANGMRILGSAVSADHRLRQWHRDVDYPKIFAFSCRRIRAAVGRALQDAGLQPGDVSRVVMTNLKRPANQFIATAAGLPKGRLFQGTVASLSHSFSADPFINLAAAEAAEPVDGPCLLLAFSLSSWCALVLERGS